MGVSRPLPFTPREVGVERFIRRHNIEHYRKLLKETSDEAQRKVLERLLAEEEAKERTSSPSDTRPD
jgi:hypothetical protein